MPLDDVVKKNRMLMVCVSAFILSGFLVFSPSTVARSQPADPPSTELPAPVDPPITQIEAPTPPQQFQLPDPLNVTIKGAVPGGTTWNPALIGVIGTLAGVGVTFYLGMWRSRRERQGDRDLKAFDDLVTAIEDLDAAYVAVSVEDPTADANSALMVQTRKFERKVRLVSDQHTRNLANAWASKIRRYTVASEEPEESAKAPTHQQVIDAQDAVLDRIIKQRKRVM